MIKTTSYRHWDRYVNQWKRTKNPEKVICVWLIFFFFTKMLSPFIKEFIVFSTNQLQQLDSQWAPTHTYYKNKLKMDQRLKIIKPCEENTGWKDSIIVDLTMIFWI